jgi:hypothetical protein
MEMVAIRERLKLATDEVAKVARELEKEDMLERAVVIASEGSRRDYAKLRALLDNDALRVEKVESYFITYAVISHKAEPLKIHTRHLYVKAEDLFNDEKHDRMKAVLEKDSLLAKVKDFVVNCVRDAENRKF